MIWFFKFGEGAANFGKLLALLLIVLALLGVAVHAVSNLIHPKSAREQRIEAIQECYAQNPTGYCGSLNP